MSSPSLIVFDEVRFCYDSQTQPVIHLDQWQVATGEHWFIQGESGSGKTTLLNLITGILLPTQGRIFLLQQDLAQLTVAQRDQWRVDQLGIVFQQFNLLPHLSVLDNVMLACEFSPVRRQRCECVLDEAKTLLTGLGMMDASAWHQPVTRLSVGQQQRVAVARALLGKPPIIVADEPTSALDVKHRNDFMDLLFEQAQAQGSSVLMVSHDPALAGYFDRHLHLSPKGMPV